MNKMTCKQRHRELVASAHLPLEFPDRVEATSDSTEWTREAR